MIYETHKRTLLKAVTMRLVAIGIEAAILALIVGAYEGLALAVLLETVCFVSHYIMERIWVRINYGRYVK